ncbi:MAG TPA: MFS transporter [Rhizomicrobium sp.]|jgi:MFS family permease
MAQDSHPPLMTDETIYRQRDFGFFISARFLSTVAMMVQSVAIGWQVYNIENTAFSLGMVGLCQFLPMFLITLPAGEISDRFDQRKVLAIAQVMQAVCAGLFMLFSIMTPHNALPFYGVLVLFGIGRGFSGPAGSSLLAFLVPPEKLARGIALSSSAFTTAVIAGPALGGFLFALGPLPTYGICLVAALLASVCTLTLGGRRIVHTGDASRLERVKEGIRFVRERPVVMGAISLDLFAVLLGGAVALLPIYARDILHAGTIGLGFLRSAPAAGAAVTAFTLARFPVETRMGSRMFLAVAIFGVATVVFGLSANYFLSLAALFVIGASDMISVYIRSTLINFATPDPMRGRVGAVNMLFIGASNELGEFESGLTAQWLGTVPAVVIGGIGTLIVVAAWMGLFPPLRKVDKLSEVSPVSA